MKLLKIVADVIWYLRNHTAPDISKLRTSIDKKYAKLHEKSCKLQTVNSDSATARLDRNIPLIKSIFREMFKIDQRIRNLIATKVHNEPVNIELNKILMDINTKNLLSLKYLLEFIPSGWPDTAQFGQECSDNAWLLVQQADHDLPFQEKILASIEKLVIAGKVDKKKFAYLYDRVADENGRLQK